MCVCAHGPSGGRATGAASLCESAGPRQSLWWSPPPPPALVGGSSDRAFGLPARRRAAAPSRAGSCRAQVRGGDERMLRQAVAAKVRFCGAPYFSRTRAPHPPTRCGVSSALDGFLRRPACTGGAPGGRDGRLAGACPPAWGEGEALVRGGPAAHCVATRRRRMYALQCLPARQIWIDSWHDRAVPTNRWCLYPHRGGGGALVGAHGVSGHRQVVSVPALHRMLVRRFFGCAAPEPSFVAGSARARPP